MNEPSGQHDEAEENYFISLSDLMTGVVFIFVILLCAFAFHYQSAQRDADSKAKDYNDAKANADAEKKKADNAQGLANEATEKAKAAEADAKEKGRKIDALSKLLRDRDNALRVILSELVDKLAARGVRVMFDPATGVIRLPEELLFDRGSNILSESGRRGLSVLAEEIVPVLHRGCAEGSTFRLEAVFIEGHTDADPIRSPRFADNWDLSAARATNTYRTLTAAKPELESFRNPGGLRVIGVSGYGENRPVAPNDTDANKKANRRVDLRFLMARPTDAELERARREIDGPPKPEK